MSKSWRSPAVITSLVVGLAVVLSLLAGVFLTTDRAEAMTKIVIGGGSGTDYYVDAVNGDDINHNGTSWADAWKTITHAAGIVLEGDSTTDPNIIHVASGTYDYSTNGEIFPIAFNEKNVTLLADYLTTVPVIDGEGAGTILEIKDTGITIYGFSIKNGGRAIEAYCGGFGIANNTFSNDSDWDIEYGVHVYFSGSDRASDFSFDSIVIEDNEFCINGIGVLLSFNLYFNGTAGLDTTIGDIDILDNDFYMHNTEGVTINIAVEDVNAGTVTVGDIDISDGNTFTNGDYGVDFDSYLHNLNNATVNIGDLMINGNTFEEQRQKAINIEHYYHCSHWDGTTTAIFGDLKVNGNSISSSYSCSGITILSYVFGEHLNDNVSITAGDIHIEDNNPIDVGGYGIWVEYDPGYYMHNNAEISIGDTYVTGNTVGTNIDHGIYLNPHYIGSNLYDSSQVTVGDITIEDNYVHSSNNRAIYIQYDHCGYELCNSSQVTMGDLNIVDNAGIVSDNSYGIYLDYDHSGYNMQGTSQFTIGDVVIQGNSNVSTGGQCDGIQLRYFYFGKEMYDATQVTTGEVHIGGTGTGQGNTIEASGVGGTPIHIEYSYVAQDMGEEGLPCEASLVMDDIYVQNNIIAGDSHGIYLQYGSDVVGSCMYGNAYAELLDYIITGNTFNVTGNGIYLYTNDNPCEIYDNATFDFGGAFIDDNTFNGTAYDAGDPMDRGVYIDLCNFCYENYDYSATIVGDYTISNNEFYNLESEAIYVYYDIGYELNASSLLQIGNLEIADNLINGAGNGIRVYYEADSWEDSTLTMGNLDITGNNISDIAQDGIRLYYDLHADGNSTQTIGRALIQDNFLDYILAHDGIFVYMFKQVEDGAINLGEPVIDRNIIEDWTNGIHLVDVDGATVSNNFIKDNLCGIYLAGSTDNIDITNNDILENLGATSGVHLDSTCGSGTTINYNNIVVNLAYGVSNDNTNVTIDAEHNWWGDPSGPDDDAGDINGSGDKISTYVDADPWLTGKSHVTIYEQMTTATGSGTVSIQTGGGAVTELESVAEGTLPTDGKPDISFPHGFFSFKIIGLTDGQEVKVTLALPDDVPEGTEYWKYGPTPTEPTDHWYSMPIGDDDGDNVITITLVDGGLGDNNLTEDGEIVEPGAPGYVPIATIVLVPPKPSEPEPEPEASEAPKTARFTVANLYVSPSEVPPNQPVGIQVDVTNVGQAYGAYDAVLLIDGEVEGGKLAYLHPGENRRVSFLVSRPAPGTYTVSVSNQSGWFTVESMDWKVEVAPPAPSSGLGTPALIAIILSAVGVGIALFFARRRTV